MEIEVQMNGRASRRWIAVALIALGAVFLVLALVLAGVTASFLSDAKRTRGSVVSLEWREDDHGEDHTPVAYPVVEFTSADGMPRRFRSSTGSNPPSYEKGDRVEVLYRAGAPEDARLNGFASLWLLPLIFGGTGLAMSVGGTALAMARRWRS
ncbi:Protein of unknown function [Streptomyces sp. 2224.1]|uniref:DUF3592 domain-containing protein n=1 Tax=unclassified Streptomyces TaxID=2593676 RepID=UPI000895F7E0|nr:MULTISPECIES: DUF3592 domain-containing protein [unclassified Streptomyces]SED57029.1 Protein of unknown function [Streptomyces sp. 2224.1]SEF18215.1 Protein of unknown function [Streptomyces sp. 2112.3]